MLNTALALTVATGVAGQVYPDELDILRGADTRPQMQLVLDTSGSMAGDASATSCAHYFTNVAGYGTSATNDLGKLDLLKAVLTGCQSATDGIIDQWANRVHLAISEFGGSPPAPSTPLGAGFSDVLGNGPALELAVLNLNAQGWTPLAAAYADAANNIAGFWSDANSESCRQNFIVLMTDGDGTESAPNTLSLGSGNAPLTFYDVGRGPGATGTYFTSSRAARHVARSDSAYGVFVDSLPNVTGTQPIRTYTIGFGPNISAAGQGLLQDMAYDGDGLYRPAIGYDQLNNAFTEIILSVVSRSGVSFSQGTVQNDGLVSGNYVYSTSFKPFDRGSWYGNTKKFCMMPADASDTNCVLMDDGSGNLIVNPYPRDIWTNVASENADVGGTGAMIWRNHFSVTAADDPVPASPYSRNILTWIPGQTDYVSVDNTWAFSPSDSFSRTSCDHNALVNRLHGYTAEATDCAANFSPVALEGWPIGDTVHGGTVLMKYTRNCETSGTDRCYVVTVANDGMLHIYRATDGHETAAVIPGHLWSANQVNTHQLRDLMNQPNLSEMRRYYFDGGVRLFHNDTNGNGYIDSGESAKLIAGLGRGGKSYILWDVSNFNGVPTAANNPPQELMVDEGSSFRHLRETWAAPWLGRYRHADNNVYNVAVFPSGHDRDLDRPTANFGGVLQTGLPPAPTDTRSSPYVRGCPAFFGNVGAAGAAGAMLCNPPLPPSGCTPCTTAAPCGLVNCYDWPGYFGLPAASPFNNGGPGGHNIILGPFQWTDGNRYATGYRFIFDRFDLQPNDYVAFLDSGQNEIGRITGSHVGGATSPWINDSTFYVQFVSDGVDTAPSTGFSLQRVEMIRGSTPAAAVGNWRPQIYMVDLERFNGASGAPATRFSTAPGAGDARQQTGVLVRVTSDCEGLQVAGEICIDATGSGGQPASPDLAYMTCPISAEPSVLEEGGLAEGFYWGDECGQIFRVVRLSSGDWEAKRLLATNNLAGGGQTITGNSADFRKIFANLEIVRSTCNGGSSIGVYFGTGNVQRPALRDNLQTDAVANYANQLSTHANMEVMGVVWDHPGLPADATLDDLENITFSIQVSDPTSGNARNGWIIEALPRSAKVLRSPLVFDGVAYFQVYRPTRQATECISAEGLTDLIAVNNCTGRPATDGNNNGTVADVADDRYVETVPADIGTGLTVYTPPDEAPVLVTGPTAYQTARQRSVKYMMWRTTID